MAVTLPAGAAEGWPDGARLQLEETKRGCLEVEGVVACWADAFRLLEDRRLHLATELAITQGHLEDARVDLVRQRDLAAELADVAARAAAEEAKLWRDHAAAVTPTWWDRYRPIAGYASGVMGTAALAGGVWTMAQGGDPGLGTGLLIGGLGLDVIGYLLSRPP